MEEFIWSEVAKHINKEEFEKLTLEDKQVQCTNLYYFIREQFSRMNPELGVENAQFDQGESQMTVPDSFPNSDSLSSGLEVSEDNDNPQAHLGSSGHPSVQSFQEVNYNRQKGLVTRSINFFRTNCQNPNFNQTQWRQAKQRLENQLRQMEAACLDFLKLPTLTFVEAIDIRRDFARRKADGDLILRLLQDQLQHFHLDSFSSSASSSNQRSASSFSNSRPSKRRMRKHRQFQKSEVSNWKKEAVYSSQEFQNHLKTETFFRRRRRDFQLSSSELSSPDLISSETDMNPASTSCQNLSLPRVTSSDPESEAESSPISNSPCLDLASTQQTRPVPQIRLRDRVPPIPARRVLHDYVPVDKGGSTNLVPERLSDDDTDSDNASLVSFYLNRHFMVDKWVQSTLINYSLLSSSKASTTGRTSGHSLV
jgi:hypothetical protein